MAAGKCNYLITYKTSAQVYSATSLSTAVKTPLPKGCKMEDRIILFMAYLPDEESLCVYPLTDEQLKLKEDKVTDKEESNVEEVEAHSEA